MSLPDLQVICGDALTELRKLPSESVHCCVTSPPYWGLRDYGTAQWEGGDAGCDHLDPNATQRNDTAKMYGENSQHLALKPFASECGKCGAKRIDAQLGLEKTPEEYVAKMVEVFREVRRVLRKDGTLFLNLGSSYAASDQRGNVLSCDNDGIAQRDSRQADSDCFDLCDECRAASLNRNSSNVQRETVIGDASLSKACKDAPSDSSPELRGASPRASHPSTTRPSFRRDRAACVPAAKASDDLPEWTSSFDGGSMTEHKMVYTSDTAPSGRPLTSGMMGITFSCKACGNLAIKPLRFKPKDMVPIPWMVAMALQSDGWWLRSDIIWAKPNPMPESVTDRCTKAHEYLFLLTRSVNYFYDAEAIKEPMEQCSIDRFAAVVKNNEQFDANRHKNASGIQSPYELLTRSGRNLVNSTTRNKRSVWTVATAPYPEAHFATYPPDLIKPCILAGTSAKGCCAKCGSPWERITERGETTMRTPNDGKGYKSAIRQDRRGPDALLPNAHTPILTVGWKPKCDCNLSAVHIPAEPQDEKRNYGRKSLDGEAREGITTSSAWPKDYRADSCGGSKLKNESEWQAGCRCRLSYTLWGGGEMTTEPCTVLDPFAGSGTTGTVALELGRRAVLIELNPKYIELIKQRCNVTVGLPLA